MLMGQYNSIDETKKKHGGLMGKVDALRFAIVSRQRHSWA
jgi:hypothetical protein